MQLPALIHLLESARAIGRCDRIIVFGSSALLASFPELGDAGRPLELSYDADLFVEPCDPQLAAVLHEALGDGSLFAQRSGYHADVLRPEILADLPPGWERRLVPLPGIPNASALSPADLVILKLQAGRAKDLDLCRHLFQERPCCCLPRC